MSTMQPGMPPQPGAPRKTSPLVWILAGLGGFLVLCFIGCSVIGFYAAHQLKKVAGNPSAAMATMARLAYPNMDVVSSDQNAGTITLRDKQTGKQATYKFDSSKGSLEVQSDEGTIKIGSNAGKLPDWVPTYPGATIEGTYSISGDQGNQGSFTLKTSDSPSKLIAFYQDQLKSAGLNVTMISSSGDAGGMITAENPDKTRTVIITAGGSSGSTTAGISVTEKK